MTALMVTPRRIDLFGLALFCCLIFRSLTPTQSAIKEAISDPYLYNTIDSSPILDHGLSGIDFTESKSPKIVEFYDPKCGACQAFKYNFIEVAKKVQTTRPDVEFYGVSCAVHKSLCAVHGTRVPKIMLFPYPNGDGVEIQKGSGTVYFLSRRLLQALRSPERISADLAGTDVVKRRLGAASEENNDEDVYDNEDVRTNEDGDIEGIDHDNGYAIITKAPEPKDQISDTQSAHDNERNEEDLSVEAKWDQNKLVEIKGVPRDQWKPVHQTDAWKNTMKELQNTESQLGAEFLKWKHEHDAKLRAHAKSVENEKGKLNSKTNGDMKRESKVLHDDSSRVQTNVKKEVVSQTNTNQIIVNQDAIPPPHVFPVNLPPEQEKKFKEFIEKKRQAAIKHERLKHPVKTLLGGRDTKKIEQDKKDPSPMNNYKSQYRPVSKSKPKADLRPEAQLKSTGEKILSKVPVVKRAFTKHSHAQDTLNDAALSFRRGLLMGVFKGKTRGPLDYKRKKALNNWFDLLSVSLPPEMGLHELIDTLNTNIDSITTSEENLNAIIKKHYIPDSNWSKSCTVEAGSLGFFCGFWKLLHIMSLGVAEQAGGLVLKETNPSKRVFSTQEAASVLREYMLYFFNCDKCTKRFVGQFDDCSFQRCNRLSDKIENVSVDSWRQFPLWLWEVHNDVSRNKANRAVEIFKSRGRTADARKFERDMRAVYPHIDQCITCFDSEGNWNIDAVYNHLKYEYWDFGHGVNTQVEEMLDYRPDSNQITSYGFGKISALSIVIAVVWWLVKKQKLRLTGSHKKHELEFSSFPSGHANVKYRDS